MKSSTLFEHGPLPPPTSASHPPDVIHVIGVPSLPRFSCSSVSVYYTERKPKKKITREAWEQGYLACVLTCIFILYYVGPLFRILGLITKCFFD